MAKKLKKLIIDRRRWGRGSNGGSLLDSSNNMCCLGFQCINLGFKKRDLMGQGMPGDLVDGVTENGKDRKQSVIEKRSNKLSWLVEGDRRKRSSNVAVKLAGINDDNDTTDAEKEEQIISLFLENGVKVIFKH